MERYGGGSIVVSDYDPAWPEMFADEAQRLQAALDPIVLAIEHIGSTAVPGIAAKPIIDLLVGVRDLTEARSCCIEPLQALGYQHIAQYEEWLPNGLFFRKGIPGPWTHHAHLMEQSNPRWQHFLLFRDHLRAHPEAAEAYAKLKQNLAAEFDDDIASYRDAKHKFVEAVTSKARADLTNP